MLMRPKQIAVNAFVFHSARAAARYIVEQEAKLGNVRKENTIAKELKRCWQGSCWDMYGKYKVHGIAIAENEEDRITLVEL